MYNYFKETNHRIPSDLMTKILTNLNLEGIYKRYEILLTMELSNHVIDHLVDYSYTNSYERKESVFPTKYVHYPAQDIIIMWISSKDGSNSFACKIYCKPENISALNDSFHKILVDHKLIELWCYCI